MSATDWRWYVGAGAPGFSFRQEVVDAEIWRRMAAAAPQTE